MTLAVEVEATNPPSRAVRLLGHELDLPPADARKHMVVIVCLGPGPQISAVYGTPAPPGSAVPPVLPEGASPVARVDLPPAAAVVTPSMITLLDSQGNPL